MATPMRAFEMGRYYHIYNRGNRKAAIFQTAEDYGRFLAKLREYSRRDGVGVIAWCLMPNHYHLILREDKDEAIRRTMRSLGTSTAKYFNWQYGSVGHLCQERYQLREVRDEADLLNLTAYVHANAGAVDDYKRYRWSSYKGYSDISVGESSGSLVLRQVGLTPQQYAVYMDDYYKTKTT